MRSILFVVFLVTSAASAQAAQWACVLENKPLKSSPVAVVDDVEEGGENKVVRIFENSASYDLVLEVEVADQTEDVLANLVNKQAGFKLSFYLDETDMLGMAEGSIESSVMSGPVKCAYRDY